MRARSCRYRHLYLGTTWCTLCCNTQLQRAEPSLLRRMSALTWSGLRRIVDARRLRHGEMSRLLFAYWHMHPLNR